MLKVNKKYYTDLGSYQGTEIVIFKTKPFQFRWFTDCGEWFLYVHLDKRWFRFSSCGFLKGKSK